MRDAPSCEQYSGLGGLPQPRWCRPCGDHANWRCERAEYAANRLIRQGRKWSHFLPGLASFVVAAVSVSGSNDRRRFELRFGVQTKALRSGLIIRPHRAVCPARGVAIVPS